MAKFERHFRGNFHTILDFCDRTIQEGSASISLEDSSDWSRGNTRVAVRVYERYSITGSNRVSLSLTLVSDDNDLFISVITSGGSQAMVFKINTFGEQAFLDTIAEPLERYLSESGQ